MNGFIKAAKILFENNIFSARDLPYPAQLIPMSAILAVIGDRIDNISHKEIDAVVLVWRFWRTIWISQ